MNRPKYKEMYLKARSDANKCITFINNYSELGGFCMGCGELLHRRYRCIECGCDNSDEDCFETWCTNELARQEKILDKVFRNQWPNNHEIRRKAIEHPWNSPSSTSKAT